MECPKCGADPVWDNRAKKLNGQMKPNGPDFACRDKAGCGWVQWPPRVKGSTGSPATASLAPVREMLPPTPYPTTPPAVAPALGQPAQAAAPSGREASFWEAFDAVMAGLAERKLVDFFKPEDITRLVATLYISKKGG